MEIDPLEVIAERVATPDQSLTDHLEGRQDHPFDAIPVIHLPKRYHDGNECPATVGRCARVQSSSRVRRALVSVRDQTLTDLECIVVDDASTDAIKPVVDEFDERFRYMRRESNGGCTAARLDGFRYCRGTYATTLDSDNEMFPWALERAASLLDRETSADCVTGLYVYPDGLRARVRGGRVLVTPSDYMVKGTTHGDFDCMGVVRKQVVEHWMTGRTDYFRTDGQMWFRMSIAFNQLFVDEPWGRFHTDASARISETPDERQYSDVVKFVEQYQPELGAEPCRPLDDYLKMAWVRLLWAKKYEEAEIVRVWMNERDINIARTLLGSLLRKINRQVGRKRIRVIAKSTAHA